MKINQLSFLKKVHTAFLVILLFVGLNKGNAQDFQFSQYHESPLYLNPAFTGLGKMHRIAINSRIQWPNLPKAYLTNALSYDYNLDHLSSGFGLMLTRD